MPFDSAEPIAAPDEQARAGRRGGRREHREHSGTDHRTDADEDGVAEVQPAREDIVRHLADDRPTR